MKKIISLTLTLLLVMGAVFVFPASAESATITSGDWDYRIMDDGNVRIYRYNGTETDLTIPDTIDGHKVTRSLTAGDNVVKTLRLGKYIEKIYPFAIASSKTLTKVTVDKNNKVYQSKDGMLLNKKGNKLVACPGNKGDTALNLPTTITYIGDDAFQGNLHLKTAVIPDKVKKLGTAAFSGCKELVSVKIPKSVKNIGFLAFGFNQKLTKIEFDAEGKYTLQSCVFEYCKGLKTAVIPNITFNKTGIYAAGNMYANCRRITKVKFLDSAYYVPAGAFYDCIRLKSVTVPSFVKKIGAKAFAVNMGDYVDKRNPDFVIKGKKGSSAEKYANKLGCKFKAI